jgi:hypothetical protein
LGHNGNGAVDPIERELEALASPLQTMLQQSHQRMVELQEQLQAERDRARRIERTLTTMLPEAQTNRVKPGSKRRGPKTHKWVPSAKYTNAVLSALSDGPLNSTALRYKLDWNSGTVSQVLSYMRSVEMVRLAGTEVHKPSGRKLKVYALMEE